MVTKGFIHSQKYSFRYSGTESAARAAIRGGDQALVRSLWEVARVTSRVSVSGVNLVIYTSKAKPRWGPVFEGQFFTASHGKVLLKGRFRHTYWQMACLMLGRVFKMHWHRLLAKTDECFVVPRSRISLQYASSSRLALVRFGLRIRTKPF